MAPREIAELAKATFAAWSEDKAPRLGAAVAYYTVFSLAPLLVIIIAIVGLVFGHSAVQGQIVGQIRDAVGNDAARLVQTMIASASKPGAGILATVVGVVTLLLGATGLFGELQEALNTIWGVKPKPQGIAGTLKARLIPFALLLGIGGLLLVSLVISAGLAALTNSASQFLPIPGVALHLLNFLISFGITALLFAMVYKVLPDVVLGWRDVWVGALVTALLFTLGKIALGFYLGVSAAGSTYGAAGSLAVLLLWLYYSAQIFFLGAEFTEVYAERSGRPIVPKRHAMLLGRAARAGMARPAGQEEQAAARLSAREAPIRPASVHGQPGVAFGRYLAVAAAVGLVVTAVLSARRGFPG